VYKIKNLKKYIKKNSKKI